MQPSLLERKELMLFTKEMTIFRVFLNVKMAVGFYSVFLDFLCFYSEDDAAE